MSEALTSVLITYRKNRKNNRLLFGTPTFEVRRGWHRKLAAFQAEQIFGYERWQGNIFGTQDWQVWVCQSVTKGALCTISGVQPGANILLHAKGKLRVQRTFAALDSLKSQSCTLEDISVHRWKELHNWIEIGVQKHALIDRIQGRDVCESHA